MFCFVGKRVWHWREWKASTPGSKGVEQLPSETTDETICMCRLVPLPSLETGSMQFLPPLCYVGICCWQSANRTLVLVHACPQGHDDVILSNPNALLFPQVCMTVVGVGVEVTYFSLALAKVLFLGYQHCGNRTERHQVPDDIDICLQMLAKEAVSNWGSGCHSISRNMLLLKWKGILVRTVIPPGYMWPK